MAPGGIIGAPQVQTLGGQSVGAWRQACIRKVRQSGHCPFQIETTMVFMMSIWRILPVPCDNTDRPGTLFGLLAVACFVLAFPSNAQVRRPNIIDSFGSIPLGSNLTTVPSGMVVQDCRRSKNHIAECSLKDGLGRSYFVLDDLVVGVSFSFDRSKTSSILGLRRGDGYEVIKRLSRNYGISFRHGQNNNERYFYTDLLKSRSCLSPCRMFISFDSDKRISKVEIQSDTPLF